MSAAPVIIIISRPKKQHQNQEDETLQILTEETDTTADILRKALEQVEG